MNAKGLGPTADRCWLVVAVVRNTGESRISRHRADTNQLWHWVHWVHQLAIRSLDRSTDALRDSLRVCGRRAVPVHVCPVGSHRYRLWLVELRECTSTKGKIRNRSKVASLSHRSHPLRQPSASQSLSISHELSRIHPQLAKNWSRR